MDRDSHENPGQVLNHWRKKPGQTTNSELIPLKLANLKPNQGSIQWGGKLPSKSPPPQQKKRDCTTTSLFFSRPVLCYYTVVVVVVVVFLPTPEKSI